MNTRFIKICAGLLIAGCSMAMPPQRKPNVIIILTDDQGYADLSCYGSKTIASPNIDRMAAEGMRLTSCYSACSVCSPSRAALLTGRMPKRVGVPAVLFPDSKDGLPPEEITLAELLKAQGYRTAIVGKWHLGHQKDFLPLNQGFDRYVGIPYSNDMPISPDLVIAPDVKLNEGYTREMMDQDVADYLKEYKKVGRNSPLMRGNAVVEYPVNSDRLTRRYTEEAIQFIQEPSDQPFFLYLAHTMPHTTWHIEKEFSGHSRGGLYGDVVEQIDWSVGEIMKVLTENGLDQNTMVIFSSDNGPVPKGGSAGPFRGNKSTTYEGGHRVPCIFWAPGVVKAGQVSDAMTSLVDIFPTIAHYAGAGLPVGRIYDGINLAGRLEGQTGMPVRSAFYYYVANTEVIDGVRSGDWKYLQRGGKKPRKTSKQFLPPSNPQLYNLKNDPGESNNLIEQFPEKARELEIQMKQFDDEIVPRSTAHSE